MLNNIRRFLPIQALEKAKLESFSMPVWHCPLEIEGDKGYSMATEKHLARRPFLC
jgi:hypothetical protein